MYTPPGSPERKHSWGAVKVGQLFSLPGISASTPVTPVRVVSETKRRVQVQVRRHAAPHSPGRNCRPTFGVPRARAGRSARQLRPAPAPAATSGPAGGGILRAVPWRARTARQQLAVQGPAVSAGSARALGRKP